MTGILEKVTEAWSRAWGDGNTDAFVELTSDDYVRHSKTGDEDIQAVVNQIIEQHAAFSGFSMDILRAIEDDNLVAIHWTSHGKHTGEFMGVPPTGRDVKTQGASFISHRDGRITGETVVWDPRDLLSAIKIHHLGDQRTAKKRTKEEAGQ